MQHVDSIDTEGACRPPPKGLRVALSLLLVAPALFAFFLLVQDSIRRQLVGQSQGEVLLLGSDSSEHDTYAQIISTHRKVFPETFYDEAHPTTFKTHMDHGKAKMHVRVKAQSHLQEQMLKGSSKVTVTIYMESECPSCRRFSTTYLKQVLQAPGVGEIIDLKIVPWGNAKVTDFEDASTTFNTTQQLTSILEQLKTPWDKHPKLKFDCQHGRDECLGNAWEACLVSTLPRHEDYFPVFDCIESRGCAAGMAPPKCVDYPPYVVHGCIRDFGNHVVEKRLPELQACVHQGSRLEEIFLTNSIATLKANAAFVPWITVDGEQLVPAFNESDAASETDAFLRMFLLGNKVCDTFVAKTGLEAPRGCASLPASIEDIQALGEDPYVNFAEPDFTVLAKEHATKMEREQKIYLEQQQKAMHESAQAHEEGLQTVPLPHLGSWRFFKTKLLVLVSILLALSVAAAAYVKHRCDDSTEGGEDGVEDGKESASTALLEDEGQAASSSKSAMAACNLDTKAAPLALEARTTAPLVTCDLDPNDHQ